jgi:acyl transferase domain-containing protein/NADPH:quinone reductase-like Zn-dependent oxidoreductase/ubiquinone/menaquinone biosynthesis C-methylase UbiE
MAPHEVGSMDPQQRGLMETTYHALENAGLTLEDVSGSKTSVHVGCFTNDWAHMQLRDTQNIPKYNAIGSAGSILANRLSWFYNLHGESMYVDTACSSSLVAMALACQGLSSGSNDMAIVGASNLILGPEFNIALSNLNFLSPSGRCKSFSADGDGYGRGEGFTTLVLKPVSKAIADGNPIRAVIQSFGMNQDGYTSGGITQPSKEMQVELIRDTYQKAGLSMADTRFFEAHGTGTAVGDPIEARAIGESFMQFRDDQDPIYVGALKSNFGHLEGTSGLASVVKTVLAVERGVIPPNTNFTSLNPNIDAEFLKLEFPTTSVPWPVAQVKRASINSFGFGGANAHIVVESADDFLQSIDHRQSVLPLSSFTMLGPHALLPAAIGREALPESRPQLLLLSATDEQGISRQAKELTKFFARYEPKQCSQYGLLEDVLSTLNTRRTQHDWKSYALLRSISDFATLEISLSKPVRLGKKSKRRLGFIFTGQGAQWPTMGIDLLNWPIIEASFARSQIYLQRLGCEWSLVDEMRASAESSRMDNPEYSQVISTAVQIALVDLADFLDVEATAVVGHSSGEIAAAYCVGFLDHESAIRVSYTRGVLAAKLSNDVTSECHKMISVGIAAEDAQNELAKLEAVTPESFEAGRLTVSCINSPKNITISGPEKHLDVAVEYFTSQNVFARKLKVGVGYHSPQMQAVSAEYLASMRDLRSKDKLSKTHMVSSTIPGRVSRETVCSGEYWVRNMVSPVRFVDAIRLCTSNTEDNEVVKKIDQSHNLDVHVQGWLEIGPHSALKGPSRETAKAQSGGDVFYTSFLQRGKTADMTTLAALGELHCQNYNVALKRIGTLGADPNRQPRMVLDLPKYSFNHSIVYWDESNRSKSFRQRRHRFHPLLGAPAMDWNPLDAKWTWTMKKDDIPWVADHEINGNMLYPASGMIVMAIEATKQLLSDLNVDPIGYELSEVSFLAPLVIANSPGKTEAQMSMVPISSAESKDAIFQFRIFTMRADDAWHEICHGRIQADYGYAVQSVSAEAEEKIKLLEAQIKHHSIVGACQKGIEASDLYDKVAAMSGLHYGPTFQPLSDIRYDLEGRAHAKILPYTPSVRNHEYTIHPSTLDGIFQLAIPSLSQGLTVPLPTLVPSRMTRLWVSALGAGMTDSENEVASIQAKFLSRRSAQGSITVLSQRDFGLRVRVDELEVTELAHDISSTENEGTDNALCYEMDWKADHALLSRSGLDDYCAQARKSYEEPTRYYENIELMLLSFTARTLKQMEEEGQESIPSMKDYTAWLRARVDTWLQANKQGLGLMNHEALCQLTANVETQSSRGRVNATVGHNLKDILLGRVDPLQLLFKDDNFLLEFYEELNTAGKAFDMLNSYLDLLVHKNPGMKFLEVGAGTGATTTRMLSVLDRPDCGTRYSTYTFTDISASFFSKAKERFDESNDRISYRVLNIEEEPLDQGFDPEEQFDVVIAAHVLHATENLGTTLANVRKLLKPNGKLILTEMTTPTKIETGFIFGTLPGWWRSAEQWRKDNASPVFLEEQWNTLLRQSGFTGTEHIWRDWDSDQCHGWSIMITSATPDVSPERAISIKPKQTKLKLLVNRHSSFEMEAAEALQRLLTNITNLAEIVTLGDELQQVDFASCDCLVLAGLETAVLSDINSQDFKNLQAIFSSSKSVLWASCIKPRSATEAAPYWAMIEGLCRTCRSEDLNIPVTTMILEENTCASARTTASQIARVFVSFQHGIMTDSYEPEYRESSGQLCINRLTQAPYLDDHVSARTQREVKMQRFNSDMPIKLDIKVPGFLDTLHWVDDGDAYEPLEPHQVEIRVQAIGVNFKECLILLGRVNTDTLGSECAGYVHRVGSAVSSEHVKVGDRVALGSLDSYRSFVRAWDFQVIRIPDQLSFADAAAIPTAFCTAYHSLINVARLQRNEKVLIHAAAGGTGQAAVQVAQHVGAEIFATVGSIDKKNLLMEQYAIPADHIFYSRDASFADAIRRITQGYGVDVVLNSLSGKLLVASWELIANFGRFIEIGRRDIDSRGHLPMHPFIRNATFHGVDLATIVENPAQKEKYCLQEVFNLVEQGVFRPSYPVQPYPIDQTEQALRVLQSGKSSGKIVLEVAEGVVIPLQEGTHSRYRFTSSATYVIAGGLGGIGRQIITWMVKRGAKHILTLSRSGVGNNEEKRKYIASLEAKGVNIQLGVCDISDRQALEETIQKASVAMPPIKGCFQAAMVLRVSPDCLC